jgi:hypothetical protein
MSCDATDWMSYKGTPLRTLPDTQAYFYVTERMAIDADGAPNAYHPRDTGIDALSNAGFPNGGWKSVLATDPGNPSQPFIQTGGPFAGFFVSKTTLQDPTRKETDPLRYVDSTQVPYIVFPGQFHALKGTGSMGDFAVVRNLKNDKVSVAIVADVGPSDAALGEVSIRLAENLGGANINPRNGNGMPKGPFLYVLFPKSREHPTWPVAADAMEQKALMALSAAGGWDRLMPCARAGSR